MYSFLIPKTVVEDLNKANSGSPSVMQRIEEMASNPFSKAIKTDIRIIGDYYVNAGRYCILFNVDESTSTITIKSIVLDNLLHKILTDRIQIPNRLTAEVQK